MKRFESTSIWQKSLAPQLDPDSEHANRELLRNAYNGFRTNSDVLAAQIQNDFPEFTAHDVTHLDALWEMAQIVTGIDYPLNPVEAFVLGGSFLLHDLGMAVAAYPQGLSDITKSNEFKDIVASEIFQSTGIIASEDQISNPSNEIRTNAIKTRLRDLHAEQAEKLAQVSWRSALNDSSPIFLIEDAKIRLAYGPIIGRIANSHWWGIDRIVNEFKDHIGALAGFPNDWTIDPLKLAMILRAADICHIDDRRAPDFLFALRSPTGESKIHWAFQNRLYQPRIENDRLAYSSKDKFNIDEAGAWWACYDTIKSIDKELREIDSALADYQRPRFTAKGVSYADSPQKMATLIGTNGWIPFDASIKVSNVSKLVSTLGGDKLYGNSPLTPLREMIQNASDAVRARRLLESHSEDWGTIVVRSGRDSDGHWIEVEDNGIGMSVNVLTGPFLDFGNSFWGTQLMRKELPGLASKGYHSAGKFGIGFFSVFMWGERVRVITRRPEVARNDTLVLEFTSGLQNRPMLRKAGIDELLLDGGTKVKVWISDDTYMNLFHGFRGDRNIDFFSKCAKIAPTLECNLDVHYNGKTRRVVSANDWTSISGEALLKRILGIGSQRKGDIGSQLKRIGKRIADLRNNDGRLLGRVCIHQSENHRHSITQDFGSLGIVSIGGFAANSLSGIAGVLIGTPYTAARDIGIPLADGELIRQWATSQAKEIFNEGLSDELQCNHSTIIRAIGGDTEKLKIALTRGGWVNKEELFERITQDAITITQNAGYFLANEKHGGIQLHDNAVVSDVGIPGILQGGMRAHEIDWPSGKIKYSDNPEWSFHSQTLKGVVIETLAKKWNTDAVDVIRAAKISTDEKPVSTEIGTITSNGEPFIYDHGSIFYKPIQNLTAKQSAKTKRSKQS